MELLIPLSAWGQTIIPLSAWDNVWKIVSKPDNVPIVLMFFLVAFFTGLSFWQMLANDRLKREKGEEFDICYPEDERGLSNKVFVWPYLLRLEFLAALIVLIILSVWSLGLDAPMEELANPAQTPNPSKAPWYFLGLQEMLVYFDPWLAGVVFPTLIVVGLMMIPYVDINPEGNGTWTWEKRKFAISVFLFGFGMWLVLIFIGTFLRGPGWLIFWPWEKWDHSAVVYQTNIDLSMLLFGVKSSSVLGSIIGGVAILGYFAATMGGSTLLVKTRWGKTYERMGVLRFQLVNLFFWLMMALPVKIFLRQTLNLKYIMKIPAIGMNV